MPELYIITGSNGAGKSTVGPDFLPPHIQELGPVFDGDKLFVTKRNELWNSGIKAPKECRNLASAFVDKTFATMVENALAANSDLAYEGHFTNEATWGIPRRFKDAGYSIHLIFFGLLDTDLSESRVIARSKEGGHYVDPRTIADNFYGNLEKLDIHFSLFDSVQIIDTSVTEHRPLCSLANGATVSAVDSTTLPSWFLDHLKTITQRIRDKETA